MKNSFTSNSESIERNNPDWKKIWLTAAVFFLVLLSAGEMTARIQGHRPSVRDGADLWSYWREKVHGKGREAVVLAGGSRMLLDFNLEAWKETFPAHEVIQLAVDGSSVLPVIEDLAADETFRGTVLCGLNIEMLSPRSWKRASWYVTYYHTEWSLEEKTALLFRLFLQKHLAILSVQGMNLYDLLHGKIPEDPYIRTKPDRGRRADYSHPSAPEPIRTGKPDLAWSRSQLPDREFKDGVRRLRVSIQRIHRRGGRVVLLHFVNRHRHFPREYYWNVMVKKAGAEACHFEDYPELRDFSTPDGSHLDYRDTQAYTLALAEILETEGVVSDD